MLRVIAYLGALFSIGFIVLQLIPIPGLPDVHFSKESYIMLVIWVLLGTVFYMRQKENFSRE